MFAPEQLLMMFLLCQRERLEKLRQQAEELAEQRKRAREEVHKWALESRDSDDEKEQKRPKKARGKTRPEPGLSGDEGEPRKKRRGGKRWDLLFASSEFATRYLYLLSSIIELVKPRRHMPKQSYARCRTVWRSVRQRKRLAHSTRPRVLA